MLKLDDSRGPLGRVRGWSTCAPGWTAAIWWEHSYKRWEIHTYRNNATITCDYRHSYVEAVEKAMECERLAAELHWTVRINSLRNGAKQS